jgi:hypothetical protein
MRSTTSAHMNYHPVVSTPAVAAAQPATHLRPQTQPASARVLKLALDVQLLQHVVATRPEQRKFTERGRARTTPWEQATDPVIKNEPTRFVRRK